MADTVHTVLVVDDTPGVRRAMERILVRAGYEVLIAEGGAEALRIAAKREIQAAVVDYQMPGIDGLSLLAQLRELHPGAVRILVSGALDMDIVMAAINRGDVSGVLHKPFDAQNVVAALRRSIRRRTASSQSWMASKSAQAESEAKEFKRLLSDGLSLGLQPIVASEGRRPVAFEGLLRSSSAVLPTPKHLLAVAERHNLEGELTRVVAAKARRWIDVLPPQMRLFLNLHPRELNDADALIDRLRPLHEVASRIVLEITEREVHPEGEWTDTTDRLRFAGYEIAIDDLGAGSSSLAVLSQIDPGVVKIDMSLIRDVDTDPRKQRLLEVLCRFSRASQIEVVAEGIETHTEADTAQSLGAEMLQGFYFGRADTSTSRVERIARISSLPPARSHSGTRRRALATTMPAVKKKAGNGNR